MIDSPGGISARPRAGTRQLLTAAVLVLGLAALGITTREAIQGSRDVSMPSAGALAACFVLTRAALSCTAQAWVRLIGAPSDPSLVRGAFYTSQLTKYLPAGGVVQAAGQIAMTATRHISVGRVSLAYLSLAASTVAAGTALGTALALVGDLDPVIRIAAALGLAAPLLMNRSVLGAALRLARRITRRAPDPELLPDQRALWSSLGWSAGNLLLYSVAFTILLRSVSPGLPLAHATVAYVVAWVAGFLVLPLPSGVGVREAMLVALVPGVAAGPLLAASLAQRLVAIAVEVTAALGNRAIRIYRR
ncbi:MAG: hypothetical protein ACOYXM_16440 [Actinomycetota bacterium]